MCGVMVLATLQADGWLESAPRMCGVMGAAIDLTEFDRVGPAHVWSDGCWLRLRVGRECRPRTCGE